VRSPRNHDVAINGHALHDYAGEQSASASHAAAGQRDSRCDAAGREHGSTTTTDPAFAVDDTCVGIVDRCSTLDDRSPRGHPTALHAGHGSWSDDDATGERCRNTTACDDSEDASDSRNHCSGNLESSGHSQLMTEEGRSCRTSPVPGFDGCGRSNARSSSARKMTTCAIAICRAKKRQ
jgi:hypothetical protein